MPLVDGAKIVLHLLPLSMAAPGVSFDVAQVNLANSDPDLFEGWRSRINMDGIVARAGPNGTASAYVQLFRSGAVESVDDWSLTLDGKKQSMNSLRFEDELIKAVRSYFSLLARLGAAGPVVLAVSLLGVRGYKLDPGRGIFRPSDDRMLLDRDDLIVPDTLVEDLTSDAAHVLKPSFDIVCNAFGWSGSLHYDARGNWTGDSRR